MRALRLPLPKFRRNLLIVRAGDDSLHPQWLPGLLPRNFDLLVSYYGATPGRYRDCSDYYHVMRGPRWPAHHMICQNNQELLARYDFVAFACDDLAGRRRDWNDLFELCRRYQLDLAQPAISGPVGHSITQPVPGCILRITNFVEIMCPVFSRRALAALQASFGESRSGWGLDVLWPQLPCSRDYRLAIIDAVQIRHSRPLREGTLYNVLAAEGVDPAVECKAITQRFGLKPWVTQEFSRVCSGSG